MRFEVGSSDYQKIMSWIRAGVPYGEEAEQQGARVERVEVAPKELVLQVGARQQLLVTAHLSNGRQEDLTEHVRYAAGDGEVADVSETGSVLAKKTGETHILIRTPGHTLSADVGVIQTPIVKYPRVTPRNEIDRQIFAKLQRFHILPSERSSDEEFLRRVCLDLTGTLPHQSVCGNL